MSYRAVFLCSALTGAAARSWASDPGNGDKPAQRKTWRNDSTSLPKAIREGVADRRVLMTSSMEGIQNISMGALEAFLPVYAVSVAGLNVFQAGLIWGVQIVVTMISKPLMGKVSDRWGGDR